MAEKIIPRGAVELEDVLGEDQKSVEPVIFGPNNEVLVSSPKYNYDQINAEDIERNDIEPRVDNTLIFPSLRPSSLPFVYFSDIDRPPAPRSIRIRSFEEFVNTELERFKAGEISNLTPIVELRDRYGYKNIQSVYSALKTVNLYQERRQIIEELKEVELEPSIELAWLLGALAEGGNVDLVNGVVSMSGSDPSVQEKFKSIVGDLFRVDTYFKHKRDPSSSKEYSAISFNSVYVAREIGDLRRTKWADTISDNHGWIEEEPRYAWSFIIGLFELAGSVDSKTGIVVHCSDINTAEMVASLLELVGIKNPVIDFNDKRKNGVQGVGIHNIPDAKIFADNVYTQIKKKQQKLEAIKQRHIYIKRVESEEKLADEYLTARNYCLDNFGRIPTIQDLNYLRKIGVVNFSGATFSNHFGGGSFIEAREYLEFKVSGGEIAREINRALSKYEITSGKQMRFVPKNPSRLSHSQAYILDSDHEDSPIIYGPNGQFLKSTHTQDYDQINAEDIERNDIEPGADPFFTLPRPLTKPEQLVHFVANELEQYKKGGVDHISTHEELNALFGYTSANKISTILRTRIPQIHAERFAILQPHSKEFRTPSPSRELAWILGAMCGAGHSTPGETQAGFSTVDKEFAQKVSSLGGAVFELDLPVSPQEHPGYSTSYSVRFNRTGIPLLLGNLSRTSWPDTIKQHHEWILSNNEYAIEFLNGIFDARGVVQLPRQNSGGELIITSAYTNVAAFLAELVVLVGVEKVNFKKSKNYREGIGGIAITNYRDIKRIASILHSSVLRKEERLRFYREFTPRRTRTTS